MQTVRADPGSFEASGEFVREVHVRQFRPAVGGNGRVVSLVLQVVEIDLGLPVRAGSDGDDPRRRACLEPVQQQTGEQKRRQMIDGEGDLQPVLVQSAFRPGEHGGVVHQYVETVEPSQIFFSHVPDLQLGSEIGDEQIERAIAAAPFDLR